MSEPVTGIGPAPTPTVWGFDHTVDGKYVVIVANTPMGQFVHFMGVDILPQVMQAMADQAALCAAAANGGSGKLEVPDQVLLDAGGNLLRLVPPSLEVREAEADDQAEQAAVDEVMGRTEESAGDDSDG